MKEIILTFRRSDFEDIYYTDGKGGLLFSSHVKSQTNTVIVFAIVAIVALVYALLTDHWIQFVIAIVVLIGASANWTAKISQQRKWRRSVDQFLDRQSVFSQHKIVLSPTGFTLVQDDQEAFERWSEIKKMDINDRFISLTGNSTYMIPRSSVSEEQYAFLRKEIGEKVRN